MTVRERRAVVGGAALVAAAGLLLRVMPVGARAMSAWHTQARGRQEMLAHTRALLAGLPRLKDSLVDVLPKLVALAPALVDGKTAAEANATLVSIVSLMAVRRGLKVVRIDQLPDTAAGAFGRVALHAELEGDIRGLTQLLRAVETGNPLLSVKTLSVDAPDRAVRAGGAEALRLGATIAAYYLPRDTAR